MGIKPVETSTDIVSAVTFSGMQEEEDLEWKRRTFKGKVRASPHSLASNQEVIRLECLEE